MEQTLRLRNQLADLSIVETACQELSASRACSTIVATEARLILEEAFTNVVKYAHDDGQHDHPVDLRIAVQGGWLELELIDRGRAFDPFDSAVDQLDRPFAERADGLMGIPLIRALTDERRYARIDGRNHLILRKRLRPEM